MKYFPIKTAVVCLLLTPFLYVLSLSYCETYLDKSYSNQIQNILMGDTRPVLQGSVRLEEHIAKNIHLFLKQDRLINRFHIDLSISVSSGTGKIIYPLFQDVDSLISDMTHGFSADEVAKGNFAVLNSGLTVFAKTTLGHGSAISLIILALFSLISLTVFFVFYRKGSLKAAKESEENAELIHDLQSKKDAQKKHLAKLKSEQQKLFGDIESLNRKYHDDQAKAKINEDEMFDEIVSLEEKLNAYIELKQNKESEILDLKSQIEKFEKRKGNKKTKQDHDLIARRFSALYKNILMNKKALAGFNQLNEEQQIKAEEVVSQLDRDAGTVVVKRKVFVGKKHKAASFEVLFAYNGRLYFRKNDNNVTEVLVIGTKNTQQKDMEFLHNL